MRSDHSRIQSHKQGDMLRIKKVKEMKDGAAATTATSATRYSDSRISPLQQHTKNEPVPWGSFLACTL